jgi:hypothetical protein
MKVIANAGLGFPKPRVHPYVAIRPGETGFVDFKREPERIETVLEDFRPLAHESAVRTFYSFLRWINGPESILETCDCALRGSETNEDEGNTRAFGVHGRLMLMYRDLQANCDDAKTGALCNALGNGLTAIDPDFSENDAAIYLAMSSAFHTDLGSGQRDANGALWFTPSDVGVGRHMLLAFRAYGDRRTHALAHLERTFRNIETVCRNVSQALAASTR